MLKKGKPKKHILGGERNARYHERSLSNKKKSFIYNSTYFYNYNLM